MILPTKKTTGRIDPHMIRLLLYGPPKIGKTTLLSGFPNILLLATERGYGALQVYKVDIKNWEHFIKVAREIAKGKHEYKTIGIDTADELFTMCSKFVVDKLGIVHVSEQEWGKGWDLLRKEFNSGLNILFNRTDYGVLLTSHTKEIEITRFGGKTYKTVPELSNQARRVLIPKVSLIGYMYADRIKTIIAGKRKRVNARVVTFEPTEYLEAGDRDGKMPDKIVTYKNPVKTYGIFRDCYEKSKKKGGAKKKKKRR